MTTIDKVMEILNNSEESKRLNRMWKECEDKANLTEEESREKEHSMRRLVTIKEIEKIHPIEKADAIELAIIGGWGTVVKKGILSVGDKVAYFEIDSALPLSNPAFEFLSKRGVKEIDGKEYHVLKTARLRGVYSQGLAIPLDELGFEDREVGEDVTSELGVIKYEPPLPIKNDDVCGVFPNEIQKTDSERIQNLFPFYETLKEYEWVATEKLDGMSCTVHCNKNNEIQVFSRNYEVKNNEGSAYWGAVKNHPELVDGLNPGRTVQGEVVGPGIQKNRLGLDSVELRVFDVLVDGLPIPREEWSEIERKHTVPIRAEYNVLPESPEELIAQVNGLKSVLAKGRQAEGLVFHTKNGEIPLELGRSTFKVINNKYLLK